MASPTPTFPLEGATINSDFPRITVQWDWEGEDPYAFMVVFDGYDAENEWHPVEGSARSAGPFDLEFGVHTWRVLPYAIWEPAGEWSEDVNFTLVAQNYVMRSFARPFVGWNYGRIWKQDLKDVIKSNQVDAKKCIVSEDGKVWTNRDVYFNNPIDDEVTLSEDLWFPLIDDLNLFSNTYTSSGSGILDYDISSVGFSEDSNVVWDAEIPAGTSILFESRISYNWGSDWSSWIQLNNGGQIPGIYDGTDMRSGLLQIRITMSTSDTLISPFVRSLSVTVLSKLV